jgi:hypothetical protein
MTEKSGGGARLPCGHAPGECGACPRCGECYRGTLAGHMCPDGYTWMDDT